MGRFLNSRASSSLALRPPPKISTFVTSTFAPTAAAPEPDAVIAPVLQPDTPVQTLGLYALCLYLVAAWANDFSQRFLGAKPYVSMIAGIVVFLCFLLSGHVMGALRTTVGKLWLVLGVWMCLSTLFSRWLGGSMGVMESYIPKQHMLPFYMAAFVMAAIQCRTVLRACILGGFILIISCIFFGQADEFGRFVIPTNVWLDNPNDLAMQLLLCLGFFLFLLRQPSWVGRVAGIIGMSAATYFLLKTGSRGAVLAWCVFIAIWIGFSQNRMRLVIFAGPIVLLLVMLTPGETLHRISLIFMNADVETATTIEDEKSISSQLAREHLLRASVDYMFRYPIFGIGPGEFSEALWEDGKKQGRHETSLGPHNTYTQIGAESGIPAFVLFIASLFLTIRSTFRLYRATAKNPAHSLLSAMCFSCFVMMAAFAVDLFFHHMAYSGNMALIIGLSISLQQAAKRVGIQLGRAAQTQPVLEPQSAY